VVTPVPAVVAAGHGTLATAPQPFDVGRYEKAIAEGAQQGLKELLEERLEALPRKSALVVRGQPADEIARVAERNQADLIVIATHGHTGWRRFLFGSVAEKVVRVAPCPVLTIQEPSNGVEQR
jgi:nucleotide-binding universal stress UspA family protein